MAFLENAHFIVMIVCAILGLGAPYVQAYFAWKAARVKERKEEEIAETISNLRGDLQAYQWSLGDLLGKYEKLEQERFEHHARIRALEAATVPVPAPAPHIVRVECRCVRAHSPASPPPPPPPPPPSSAPQPETFARTAVQAAPEVFAPATTSARETEAGPRWRSTEAAKAKAAKKDN